ncbi:LCP family glycopolymer transferase [Sphaerisporangium corydalis]|uniref:LCP family protein n=1 Tax=Sphaerisporangium corydalis TaxID=1441875 RepID=A0ABV9EAH6_9ACTN|nr:LCP family protein [Sphaerisporangium corydalis]
MSEHRHGAEPPQPGRRSSRGRTPDHSGAVPPADGERPRRRRGAPQEPPPEPYGQPDAYGRPVDHAQQNAHGRQDARQYGPPDAQYGPPDAQYGPPGAQPYGRADGPAYGPADGQSYGAQGAQPFDDPRAPRQRDVLAGPLPPPGEPARRGRRRGDGEPPRKGGGKRPRVLAWVSIALTSVMVLVALGGYTLYRNLLGNFRKEDVSADLNANRPVNTTGALNVLLVGSDSRAGDNKRYGQHMGNEGERTDTIILMHISPNRDKATLISFPRDSMVQIPACKNARTKAALPPRLDMINSAFNEGGMGCTINTIESTTNIRVDHYIKVDFTGFKNIVDALGGIQICVPQAVHDKQAKLDLTAGKQIVKGETALAYVRARHSLGDGSDISRIKRQQIFLSQVAKKATSGDTLTTPTKLLSLVTAAAQSVVMDPQLDVDTLLQIGQSARSLTAKGVKFVTVPWEAYPADKNRVQWKQPDAGKMFESLRTDVEVTPTAKPSASSSSSTTPAKPAVKPGQVRIQVVNGTNTPGKAKEVAEALAAQGFKVTQIGDARPADGTDRPKTLLRYAKNAADGADYATPVASKLLTIKVAPGAGKVKTGLLTPFTPLATTTPPAGTTDTPADGPIIQLVIGADFKGVKVPVTIPDSARVVDSKTDVCST